MDAAIIAALCASTSQGYQLWQDQENRRYRQPSFPPPIGEDEKSEQHPPGPLAEVLAVNGESNRCLVELANKELAWLTLQEAVTYLGMKKRFNL